MKQQDMIYIAAGGLALWYILTRPKTTTTTLLPVSTVPTTSLPVSTNASTTNNLLTSITKLFTPQVPAATVPATIAPLQLPVATAPAQSVADQQAASNLQTAINNEEYQPVVSTGTYLDYSDTIAPVNNGGDDVDKWAQFAGMPYDDDDED